MSESKSYYTPFALRTGLFYSYRRTLTIWFALMIPYVASNLLTGSINAIGSIFVLSTFSTIIVAATWTVRSTVDSLHELLGFFDDSNMHKLKISFKIKSNIQYDQTKIRKIFTEESDYQNFRQRVFESVCSRFEIFYLCLGGLAIGAALIDAALNPPATFFANLPMSFIGETIWYFFVLPFIGLSAIGGMWIIFRLDSVIKEINNSNESLKVRNYVRYLRGELSTESEVMLFNSFFSSISYVGGRIYRCTTKTVVTLVVAVMWVVLNDISINGMVTGGVWLLTFIIIPIATIVFILPQLRIHTMLSEIKMEIVEILYEVQDNQQLMFSSLMRNTTTSFLSDNDTATLIRPLYDGMRGMQLLTKDMQSLPTWAFRMPTALKLVFTSLLPIVVAIGQTVLVNLLNITP